ncbi:MAG TPA: SDR family NAD(P)-dependent oxidoreductase [Pseudomonadales bacterium]|nr:SDR family NAD(P)-dependent oxidoreductase [Pseudomonadales bacterium]
MKKRATVVDLRGKHIIVTGASEGSLGFATAQILASWGAHVFISTRSDPSATVNALRKASGGVVDGFPLDLTNTASVNAFAAWYGNKHGERLDVLINNAGIHLDLRSEWKTPTLTADGYEIHWRTNYLGTAQFTHALLPLLQKTAQQTGDARIVNVVSQLHSKGRNSALFAPLEPYNSWRAYGTSKLALVHFTTALQQHFASEGLQAYCLHPGAVYTRIADKGLAGHFWIGLLRKLLAPVEALFLLSPTMGAQTSLYCATEKNLRGGHYYVDCTETPACADAQDTAVATRLWNETLAWINKT